VEGLTSCLRLRPSQFRNDLRHYLVRRQPNQSPSQHFADLKIRFDRTLTQQYFYIRRGWVDSCSERRVETH